MSKNLPVKKFHIEAIAGDYLLIGTDIRARNKEQAENLMRVVFKDRITQDTEFVLIKEDSIH
tara:strand:- start:298 stop:483 length:186 start_codon:yes stop_codon:yes gene_type:complete